MLSAGISKPATWSAIRSLKYCRAALDHEMSSSGRDNARVDFLVGNLFFAVGGMDQRCCCSCDFRDFPVCLYGVYKDKTTIIYRNRHQILT